MNTIRAFIVGLKRNFSQEHSDVMTLDARAVTRGSMGLHFEILGFWED